MARLNCGQRSALVQESVAFQVNRGFLRCINYGSIPCAYEVACVVQADYSLFVPRINGQGRDTTGRHVEKHSGHDLPRQFPPPLIDLILGLNVRLCWLF